MKSNQQELDPPMDAQRVALPAHLTQRLEMYRIGMGVDEVYVARDRLMQKSYDFEPWQFFVLQVLPGCEERDKLSAAFEDRFGETFPEKDVREFFASLADANILSEAAWVHPLLQIYRNKTYGEEDGRPALKSFRALSEGDRVVELRESMTVPKKVSSATPGIESISEEEVLPAGLQDATDFDPRKTRRLFLSFQPARLLKVLSFLTKPLKHLTLVMPLLVGTALTLSLRNSRMLMQDASEVLRRMNFLEHLAFSLITLNLSVILTTAIVSYNYRATVRRLGVAFFFGVVPRFALSVGHVKQLTRRERLWLHGAPLLVRLFIASAGVLAWRGARGSNPFLSELGLVLAVAGFVGLCFSANPLAKGSGYHLLSTWVNEPQLRGKSFRSLIQRVRGGAFKEASEPLLATYAVMTTLFLFGVIAFVVTMLGSTLHHLQLGGSVWLATGVLTVVLVRRAIRYLSQMQEAYERSQQFERWRRRALPAESSPEQEASRGVFSVYLWRALPLCLLPILFLPYSYSPGGTFKVTPSLQQVVATDVSGVVTRVLVNGGERLKAGALIAELDTAEPQAQVNVLEAEMNEQRALIDDLKSRPRSEDVALAVEALEVSEARSKYDKSRLERLEEVYKKGIISVEEIDKARGDYEVSLRLIDEKRAQVRVAQVGPSKEMVAAAEAKWESIRAKRDASVDKVRRSTLKMPFDGRLLTLRLKEKGNAYYERGEAFAAAEQAGAVTAELEIPELDLEYLKVGAEVDLMAKSFSSRLFHGKVVTIDWNITERPFGNVVKVMTEVHDPNEDLRNGMVGYAKVKGPTLPTWEVFSLTLVRFFTVEIWSWIP